MYKKNFITAVKRELRNLKAEITPEQAELLNPTTFNGTLSTSCFYGQLTGFFISEEASRLKQKCAVAFSNTFGDKPGHVEKIKDRGFKKHDVTYLEAYIYHDESKFAEIIAYLKGEIKTLPEM
jgi:hypothetical protein